MIVLNILKIRFLPAYLLFTLKKVPIQYDLVNWKKMHGYEKKNNLFSFIHFMDTQLEFRSLFYYRMGFDSRLISWLAPGESTIHIITPFIGKGFFINHGHSTQINAKRIGDNFQVWHNVTIGVGKQFDNNSRPTIGNNVKVCAGAIVIGDITIGNNVTIGAGTVVVKSIPDNCVVVGNPARIIKRENHDI